MEYAALDALVATEIFLRLVETKINSIHHRRGCTTNNNGSTRETDSSDVLWQAAVSICQGVVDVNFSGKTSKKVQIPVFYAMYNNNNVQRQTTLNT